MSVIMISSYEQISESLKNIVKILGIKLEYIKKHNLEDNESFELFYNSLKIYYIWVSDL